MCRYPPLEHWKSERLVYQRDEGIIDVIKSSVPTPLVAKRAKSSSTGAIKKIRKKRDEDQEEVRGKEEGEGDHAGDIEVEGGEVGRRITKYSNS